MSKTMVLRTTTHIHQEGVLSLCGLPIVDILAEGEGKKIGGVAHDDVACKQCLLLLHEGWEQLVKDHDEAIEWQEAFSVYSEQDMKNLLACLELVANNPALAAAALLDKNDKDAPVAPPPAKKAATKRPARKKT